LTGLKRESKIATEFQRANVRLVFKQGFSYEFGKNFSHNNCFITFNIALWTFLFLEREKQIESVKNNA